VEYADKQQVALTSVDATINSLHILVASTIAVSNTILTILAPISIPITIGIITAALVINGSVIAISGLKNAWDIISLINNKQLTKICVALYNQMGLE
jgi:type III secretory pathway component EscU